MIVYENILIRSWDAPANAELDCAGQLVGNGFEGIHIFDITDPSEPGDGQAAPRWPPPATRPARRQAAARTPRPPSRTRPAATCTSTTAVRAAPATASTSSASSSRTPTDAKYLAPRHARPRRQLLPRQQRAAQRRRHQHQLRHVRGRQRPRHVQVRPDARRPTPPGGVENPTLLWSQVDAGVTTGHSGSFTYDGKYLIYGHEPGGGSAAAVPGHQHRRSNRTLFFLDPQTGDDQGHDAASAPADQPRELHVAQLQRHPDQGRLLRDRRAATSRASRCSTSPNPAAPREIAYADPAPLQNPAPEPPATGIILGGDWSTYWHNGFIYESDIKRGVITWQPEPRPATRRRRRPTSTSSARTRSRPRTRRRRPSSYAPDPAPTITVASPAEGARLQGRLDGHRRLHVRRQRGDRVVRRRGRQRRDGDDELARQQDVHA